ncbi:MAG: TRAP transporter TatT component family protein, partial [Gammaproteobacteria bacterium]|nr:TRAP transporter TatT component family protein [Gammaproteobacteria bacterium]
MLKSSFTLTVILVMTGCASLMSSVTSDMAENLTQAILNQNDLQTVRDGAPAYLLMIDSMIEGEPDNPRLLLSGAKLYASYTTLFVDDEDRAKRLSETSLKYARSALCQEIERVCQALVTKPAEFIETLALVSRNELPVLYGFASAWAGWMQQNSADWNALAELPKLTAIFER